MGGRTRLQHRPPTRRRRRLLWSSVCVCVYVCKREKREGEGRRAASLSFLVALSLSLAAAKEDGRRNRRGREEGGGGNLCLPSSLARLGESGGERGRERERALLSFPCAFPWKQDSFSSAFYASSLFTALLVRAKLIKCRKLYNVVQYTPGQNGGREGGRERRERRSSIKRKDQRRSVVLVPTLYRLT